MRESIRGHAAELPGPRRVVSSSDEDELPALPARALAKRRRSVVKAAAAPASGRAARVFDLVSDDDTVATPSDRAGHKLVRVASSSSTSSPGTPCRAELASSVQQQQPPPPLHHRVIDSSSSALSSSTPSCEEDELETASNDPTEALHAPANRLHEPTTHAASLLSESLLGTLPTRTSPHHGADSLRDAPNNNNNKGDDGDTTTTRGVAIARSPSPAAFFAATTTTTTATTTTLPVFVVARPVVQPTPVPPTPRVRVAKPTGTSAAAAIAAASRHKIAPSQQPPCSSSRCRPPRGLRATRR